MKVEVGGKKTEVPVLDVEVDEQGVWVTLDMPGDKVPDGV